MRDGGSGKKSKLTVKPLRIGEERSAFIGESPGPAEVFGRAPWRFTDSILSCWVRAEMGVVSYILPSLLSFQPITYFGLMMFSG